MVFLIGILLLGCTMLYANPRTAILSAILVTAYLGGATARQLRACADIFPIIFHGILGVFVRLGIYLQDERFRELIPLRNQI